MTIIWNTLANEGIKRVDPEWKNIRQVFIWADEHQQHQLLIELLAIVVHYMDRRFQNSERVYYAQKAAEAANIVGLKEEEALFRIDTLGWTLIDENRFEDARKEITVGLRIAEGLHTENEKKQNLLALAKALLARVSLQQGNAQKAWEEIQDISLSECSPAVRSRVYMVAGDTAYKERNSLKAVQIFQEGFLCAQAYGNEGAVFEHRLGLAHLALEDFLQAEAFFHEVLSQSGAYGVTIEMMYAKYGLARVAQARGEREKALLLAQETWEELSRLLKAHYLIDQVYTLLEELNAL